MNKNIKRQHSPEFQTQVVMELLKSYIPQTTN